MTKKFDRLLILTFALFLAACGSNTTLPNTEVAAEPPAPTPTEEPFISSSVAQCTANSADRPDFTLPNDWITGATEGYAVTLVEYGDFQ
ncbi:MAG: hypothetical protein N2D54_12025 [Chloroflexota bacterium]